MTEVDHVTTGIDPLQADIAIQSLAEMDSLSYEEYLKKIDEVHDLLKTHWMQDQRVKALKVAIQLTKLLAETGQLKLYSRKYKMITDIIDEFGRLIYARVHSIASHSTNQNEEQDINRQSASISSVETTLDESAATSREIAKDICRNWFLKIASIRELVPRFYCELAILKVCDILLTCHYAPSLETPFYTESLRRLTKTAWGFGDPIVALHARLYLCRVSERLIGWKSQPEEEILFDLITSNLRDSLVVVCNLDLTSLLTLVRIQHADLTLFYDLISSTVQSMLGILKNKYEIHRDDENLVNRFKKALEDISKITLLDSIEGKSILAKCVVVDAVTRALPEDVMSQYTPRLLDILNDVHTEFQSKYVAGEDLKTVVPILYSIMNNFLVALDSSETFEQENDIDLSKHIMESIHVMHSELLRSESGNSRSLSPHYIKSFHSLISFTNHYIGQREVDKLVSEFTNKIQSEHGYSYHCQTISAIIKTLFSNKSTLSDYKLLTSSQQCTRLIDYLRKDNYRLEVSQWILETMRSTVKMNSRKANISITDKSTINIIMKLCAAINDSLSFFVTDDDCKHLSQLVIFFLELISISDHKEKLDFFSRLRGSSGNLELTEYLSRQVLNLAVDSQNTGAKSSHKKNFLNGCLAFVFVSIPAIKDEMPRLVLILDGCRLALEHTSLSMADYFVGQTIIYLDEQIQKELTPSPVKIQSYSASNSSSIQLKKPQFSKPLLELVETFLTLVRDFQEHIDLNHKLALSDLIKRYMSHQAHLMRNVGLLDCYDVDKGNNTDVS